MKLFSEETLAHYGIPGQKKGVRRWQYEDGRFNEEGKERYFGSKNSIIKEGLFSKGKYYDKQGNLTEKGKQEYNRRLNKFSKKLGKYKDNNWLESYNESANILNNKIIPYFNQKYGNMKNRNKYEDYYNTISNNIQVDVRNFHKYQQLKNIKEYNDINNLIKNYGKQVKNQIANDFISTRKNFEKSEKEYKNLQLKSGKDLIKNYLEPYKKEIDNYYK